VAVVGAQAQIELLRDGKVLKVRVQLKGPHKLIPSHIGCAHSAEYHYIVHARLSGSMRRHHN